MQIGALESRRISNAWKHRVFIHECSVSKQKRRHVKSARHLCTDWLQSRVVPQLGARQCPAPAAGAAYSPMGISLVLKEDGGRSKLEKSLFDVDWKTKYESRGIGAFSCRESCV